MFDFLLNIQAPYWPPQLPFSLYFCPCACSFIPFISFLESFSSHISWSSRVLPILGMVPHQPIWNSHGTEWSSLNCLSIRFSKSWLISGTFQPTPPSCLNSLTCWITHATGFGVITFLQCWSFNQTSSHIFTLFPIPTCQLHPCCRRCLASVHPFQI